MALTPLPTTSSLAVKLWAVEALRDQFKTTVYGRMLRRKTIYTVNDLATAKRGDSVTISYTGILTGEGTLEGGTLVGNEEALDNSSFEMRLGLLRHAVASPNDDTIEQERTYIDFADTAKDLLGEWHASRIDASVFNQLGGVDSTTITVDTTVYSGTKRQAVQGLNTIAAPSSNRIIRAGGAANDESLTSTDTFSLDLLDAATELLGRTYPNVRPLDNEEFDLYISYEQWTDLKRDSAGKIQWYTNSLAAMEGGRIDNNGIMMGSLYSFEPVGKYGRVNIIPAFRVANGQNSSTNVSITNVRRAILCGKQAGCFASRFNGILEDKKLDKTDPKTPMKFFTELKDYEYEKGIEARMIYGFKKKQFEGQDWGSCVISTFAAPHTS